MNNKEIRNYLDRIRDAQTQITNTMNEFYSELEESGYISTDKKEVLSGQQIKNEIEDQETYDEAMSVAGFCYVRVD